MDNSRALVYYRKNYLLGVARPGALSYDGVSLTLQSNDLKVEWAAPLASVAVKKGMGILTVSIDGAKASILTAIGSKTSPSPSADLKALLESGTAISDAPSVGAASWASVGTPGIGVYAQGQKALREFFSALGVMS